MSSPNSKICKFKKNNPGDHKSNVGNNFQRFTNLIQYFIYLMINDIRKVNYIKYNFILYLVYNLSARFLYK